MLSGNWDLFLNFRRLRWIRLNPVLAWVPLFILPIVVVSLIQYGKYGTQLFLGWDTPTYVWWSQRVIEFGPVHVILEGYPNLYVLGLVGFGSVVGGTRLAE